MRLLQVRQREAADYEVQSTIARQKLAAYPPDIVIEIARNACGTLEFNPADEIIELGRKKARALLSEVGGICK